MFTNPTLASFLAWFAMPFAAPVAELTVPEMAPTCAILRLANHTCRVDRVACLAHHACCGTLAQLRHPGCRALSRALTRVDSHSTVLWFYSPVAVAP